MLTRRQHSLLTFINDRTRESGVSPTFDEMRDALDLKSKSGVHLLVAALEQRGFVRRIAKHARAIEVIKLPADMEDRRTPAVSRCGSRLNRPPTYKQPALPTGVINIPLVGRMAAGTPIEALQNRISDVPVPVSMLREGGHYALEVTGDSMINAGILDGDTVIIQEADVANTGEIVVALVDNQEATLKRLRRRGEHIALEASNPAYETRLYASDRVRIQGKLVGLLRCY